MEETNKSKAGAPRKEIDFKEFEKMCVEQCTEEEIANIFGISVGTLQTRVEEHYGVNFCQFRQQKLCTGKRLLRQNLMRLAATGNPSILIWLSKQFLGMKDKHEVDQNTTIQINIDKTDSEL